MENPVLHIVVPCYNEQDVLPLTHKRLVALLHSLAEARLVSEDSRVTYVDDGSTDSTWDILAGYAEQSHGCALRLSANVGQQNALLAGLEAVVDRADVIVTMDADLQDDIEVIRQMVERYRQGCDIVYGVRRHRRSDTWFKRTTALAFYRLMRHLGVSSVYNHADFRLMSRRAVKALLCYRERNLFLRGVVTLVGFKTDRVYYDRAERAAGHSKYPLHRMVGMAVDGITSFSIRPVRMVLTLGVVFMFIALAMLAYVLIAYFTGRAVSGWASIVLSLWFIGGCILVGLGVVGEYIGKIYIEVKDRPRYHIEQIIIK